MMTAVTVRTAVEGHGEGRRGGEGMGGDEAGPRGDVEGRSGRGEAAVMCRGYRVGGGTAELGEQGCGGGLMGEGEGGVLSRSREGPQRGGNK